MPTKPPLTWWDPVLYSWTSVFILCIVVGFAPFALTWLLFPRWHRGRMRRRAQRNETTSLAAYEAWAIKTFR